MIQDNNDGTVSVVYSPQNVCSKAMVIQIEKETHKILNAKILGGCPGNLLGISKIIVGMKAEDVVERFNGVSCGGRPTSCPDQMGKALVEFVEWIK